MYVGECTRLSFPFVICTVSRTSSDWIQTLSPPLRSETNTTRRLSGLNRGCASNAMPLVSRVAVLASIGIV